MDYEKLGTYTHAVANFHVMKSRVEARVEGYTHAVLEKARAEMQAAYDALTGKSTPVDPDAAADDNAA